MRGTIVYLPKVTLNYLKDRIPNIGEGAEGVSQEALDKIDYVNLNCVEIEYLQYFRNLKTLIIDGFPGTDDDNFDFIARNFPDLTTLIIKAQPNLTKIDLSNFTKLKTLSIISNENLVEVRGLYDSESSLIGQLNKFEFYDNNNYSDVANLVKAMSNINEDCSVELDALYFIDSCKCIKGFEDRYNNFEWHEKIAFVQQVDLTYSSGEMDAAYGYAKSIVNTIIKPRDTKAMKVFVIYTWILKNIKVEDIRDRMANEGIVNALKNKVASIPTIAKCLQFILRVAGIESFDINVLPRLKFNTSQLGTFKIPSSDYEIVKIPCKKGDYYFDIAWDYSIYKKTGKLSTVFMYNGIEDFLYNHKMLYNKNDNPTESMLYEDRESYSKKAVKRLHNMKNAKIEEILVDDRNVVENIIANLSSLQINMDNFNDSVNNLRKRKKNLEDKIRNGKQTMRTSSNIKVLDKMIDAAESSAAVLRDQVYELERMLLERLMVDDMSAIEQRLGDIVTPFKKKVIDGGGYIRVTKSKDDLGMEFNKIRNSLNRDASNKTITVAEYKSLMDKVTKIYTYLITFAFDKKVIIDSN